MKNTLLFALFLFGVFCSQAQQETQLNLLHDVWQSNRTNPALVPDSKLSIGLPSLYNSIYFSGASFGDWTRENEEGKTVLTPNRAIEELKDQNRITGALQLETISLGFWLGKVHLSAHHAIRGQAWLDYPKTLSQFISQGNLPFVGETVDLSHNLQLFAHSELGLGLAIQPIEQLRVGGKVKFLNGIADISTTRNQLSLRTEEEIYQLQLTTDYQINTSSFFQYNGFDDLNNIVTVNNIKWGDFLGSNRGLAFDFGVTLTAKKSTLGLSLLDVGSIKWNKNVSNYSTNGTYEYTGLDIARDFFNDSLSINQFIDSLKTILDIQTTNTTYRTNLPARFYFFVNHELNDRLTLGTSFYSTWYQERLRSALGVQLQYQFTNWLSAGAHYSIYNQPAHHFGGNFILNLGALQLYGITNGFFPLLSPNKANNFDFRVGLNFALPSTK